VTTQLTNVSDTAVWVAVYRALESQRPDAVFQDPFAKMLAGERGFEMVAKIPQGLSGSWAVVSRTVVFDQWIAELIKNKAIANVVNFAAGLDARPYRLQLPADLRWIEVDFAPILDYKANILKNQTPRCQLERWDADLANPAERNHILEKIAAIPGKTLLITEGLLVYLSETDLNTLVSDFSKLSQIQYWITDLNSPAGIRAMQKKWGKNLNKAKATMQFAPPNGATYFEKWGWSVRELVFNTVAGRKIRREINHAGFWRYIGFLFSKEYRERVKDPTKLVLFSR